MMETKTLEAVAGAIAWMEKNSDKKHVSSYATGLTQEWKNIESAELMNAWTGDFASLNIVIQEIRLAGVWPFFSVGLAGKALKAKNPEIFGVKDSKREIVKATAWNRQPELVAMMMELDQSPDLVEEEIKLSWMRKGYELGYMYERDYKGCAQCTLAAVLDLLEREEPTLFRSANGFAAGMSLYGDGVCGGYSGGVMALGLFAGRTRENFDGDRAEKDKCYALTKRLHDRFIENYGTVICGEVHKEIFGRSFSLRVLEDKPAFEEAGAHNKDKCPVVVGSAAAWVAEILVDEGIL
jgi:C_GCAxxG_C_C family probable redox protein